MTSSCMLRRRVWIVTLLMLALAGCAGREMKVQEEASTPSALSIERAMILASARQALGIPYRYGGTTSRGLDCSGLVQMAYAAAGIQVPRTAHQQFSRLPERDTVRPGDLLFFGSGSKATHVGIYLGERQMIHAPGSGRQVTTTSLDLDYWQNRYLGTVGPAP
ncbi:NlpC/P60 family protein [Modicisalibacter ilicicola DSM 19980]|uniref:NlpC/P60 family protein n=1 Tax=Modicisalibacter ilicicola DSM 19980 TaxID=1121942 RepID=A0A1M5EK08_9GAMM|nr:C40 family peptidase [Halomonas ilicicola]SHF79411.1 NlpC/P60 family protein [Halomonas ilicicola DSM 19980]